MERHDNNLSAMRQWNIRRVNPLLRFTRIVFFSVRSAA